MKIIFGKDYIQITEGKKEVAYWDIQEWIDEPEIVFSIANAVKLALTDPEKLKELIDYNSKKAPKA